MFIDSCTVVEGAKLFHLLFIKTNERMGGYVNGVYVRNIKSVKIDLGVLGIETDVLYQWRTLVPTYEKKVTPIKNVFLENVSAGEVKFVSRVLGQKDSPVENVSLKNVTTGTVQEKKHIHEHLVGFSE